MPMCLSELQHMAKSQHNRFELAMHLHIQLLCMLWHGTFSKDSTPKALYKPIKLQDLCLKGTYQQRLWRVRVAHRLTTTTIADA